jgi:nicotinate phosphoribosyltransferase
MSIIRSILDTDLYKLTMQKAVLDYRQNVPVRYVFNNRRPEGKFNNSFASAFEAELDKMKDLTMSDDQCKWLRETLPWIGEDYIQYLKNYRFDPNEVNWAIINGELQLSVVGTWERTILWEVPLMALISELFFKHCDLLWDTELKKQAEKIEEKGRTLDGHTFTDFGTRRRRGYEIQDLVVGILKKFSTFNGTSNVHLAHKHSLSPIGTMAHEWIMGISALEGLRHANSSALNIWSRIFGGRLGIALTDTFGSEAFFRDFNPKLARLYDGVRHDSSDPFEFVEKTISAYRSLGIEPNTKKIVFSDSLNPQKCLDIADYCAGRIQAVSGIGTNFTNDFAESPALNMVIKLASCNNVPVVKLSDSPTKAIGDRDALRVARWTFFNTPLDQ